MSEATGVGGSQTRLFEGRRPDLGSEGRRPHVFRSLRAILPLRYCAFIMVVTLRFQQYFSFISFTIKYLNVLNARNPAVCRLNSTLQ